MKNQYFGDVGDYGKYAMLRMIAGKGVKIALNWYLTEDDGSNDGKFTTYLHENRYERYDTVLYKELQKMIDAGDRSVLSFEKRNLIPNAIYFHEILTDNKEERLKWHRDALLACDGAQLVFLDPDNGACESRGGKSSSKFCFTDEMADYYRRGQDIVYYCQKARRTYEQWEAAKGVMKKMLPDCKILVVTYHKGTQRSYIYIMHKENYKMYVQLLQGFVRRWRPLFTEEPSGVGQFHGEKTGEKIHITNSSGVEMTIEEKDDGYVDVVRSDRPGSSMRVEIDRFFERFTW